MIDQGKTMKFRDPKTGEVFEDIFDARERFCRGKDCDTCVMPNACRENLPPDSCSCADFTEKHPAEAARLMGYEVAEETFAERLEASVRKDEDNMETTDKPRICQVLGVEVGERFTYPGMVGEFYITENGTLVGVDDDGEERPFMCASTLINCHDRILRKPRFTEDETAIARGLHRVWPDGELRRRAPDDLVLKSYGYGFVMPVPADMFSGLLPGQSVKLEEATGHDRSQAL